MFKIYVFGFVYQPSIDRKVPLEYMPPLRHNVTNTRFRQPQHLPRFTRQTEIVMKMHLLSNHEPAMKKWCSYFYPAGFIDEYTLQQTIINRNKIGNVHRDVLRYFIKRLSSGITHEKRIKFFCHINEIRTQLFSKYLTNRLLSRFRKKVL